MRTQEDLKELSSGSVAKICAVPKLRSLIKCARKSTSDIRIATSGLLLKRSSASPLYRKGAEFRDAVSIDTSHVITMITGCLAPYADQDPKARYLLEQFTSKYCDESQVPASVRASAALEKLRAAEVRNKNINDNGFDRSKTQLDLSSILLRASKLISDVLGSFNMDEFLDGGRFSNGASTSRPKKFGHPYFKYSVLGVGLDVTKSAWPYAHAAILRRPRWAEYCGRLMSGEFPGMGSDSVINVVSWNKVGTVPKKTDCDRATASEPDLNMFLQLSIGAMIRKRLRRIGINLRKQDTNKNLARLGSVGNHLATIDLSSASDLNSYRLVWELLPKDWFRVMDDCRVKFGKFPDGTVTRWEMFSSMGNGFTFELESLLFWAISKAAAEASDTSKEDPLISVYGDDIICPGYAATDVVAVLESVGHKPNTGKTFTDGPFRESCGGHYHNGIDITPFYIRGPIDKLSQLIRLGNQIRKWSCQGVIPDVYLLKVWQFICCRVPKEFRGGRDVERSDALVTSERPNLLLAPLRTLLCDTGICSFFVWAQNLEDRNPEVITLDNVPSGRTISDKGHLYVLSNDDVKASKAGRYITALILSDGFAERAV